jgi:predicted aspartyl protease
MIWITGFALLTALLIATSCISRRRVALPIIAVLAAAAGLEAFSVQPAVQGLRPTLDMPQLLSATELKADRNGHYVTEADINGSTIAVMVDTGATGVALSYEDAEKVGLRPRGLDFDIPINTRQWRGEGRPRHAAARRGGQCPASAMSTGWCCRKAPCGDRSSA